MKVLTYMNQTLSVVAYKSLRQRKRLVGPKVVMVAFGSGRLREILLKSLSDISNGVPQRWL